MNEVVAVIGDEAGSVALLAADELEAERTEGIGVFEAGGVRL